ncbi:MAG: 1-acyl-sn-glycerol-3-phosphate acyltransferase, partial [Bacteriovoracaceae bacterium]
MFTLAHSDKLRIERITEILKEEHPKGEDPWGLDVEMATRVLKFLTPIYRNYFKVRIIGAEKVKAQAYVVISNHSGQIPIDAMLISMAFLLDIDAPHLVRPMVERFMTTLPFINKYASSLGAVLGDRQNAHYLLSKGQSILVFPEGVKGISKSSPDFYNIKEFSSGFYRMAATHQTPILPIAVIGAEEMYPFVIHIKSLANLVGFPALPLSLNLIPLPSPIDIYIGDELIPRPNESEKTIGHNIYLLEQQIKKMIVHGLARRRPFF